MKLLILFCSALLGGMTTSLAQKADIIQLKSPNGALIVEIKTSPQIEWSVKNRTLPIITPSRIALRLNTGEVLGDKAVLNNVKYESSNADIAALNYKKALINDKYNQVTLSFKGKFGVIFRAYDDGIAYRLYTSRKDSLTIRSEDVQFSFPEDQQVLIPYVNVPDYIKRDKSFHTSFENFYQHINLSEIAKDTLSFTPMLVEYSNNVKVVITEADLESYPGMFLKSVPHTFKLEGMFAAYPLEESLNENNDAEKLVTKRANYIAKTAGTRKFPWRVVIISEEDKSLLNNDMVYKLAAPSRIADVSWIRPGKAIWDWWNGMNISHVDFRAGNNTATYKYYIDFAAAHHLEYSMIDAGWSDSKDLMKISPGVDLKEITRYAKSKNVGIWLWSGTNPMNEKMEEALSVYSEMGVKGFKVDFMDRDDQEMVDFTYRLAKKAAEHHLMLDYHGTYKPTGIQRTFPNILNFEGVRGMENDKWAFTDPGYEATIPFIRMMAGPMDFTPGAMKNENKDNFRSVGASPMSQGTRCHQLAMYILYESPFEMLSDNPNNYDREKECVDFISAVPTVFDETVALDGKAGQYAAIARKYKDEWFIGALGNWNTQDIPIDLSFLGKGKFKAEIFMDGINADREATDYKRQVITVSSVDRLTAHLGPGGGWVAKITPIN